MLNFGNSKNLGHLSPIGLRTLFLLSADGFVHASSNSVEAVVAAIDSNIVPVPPPASQTYNTGPVLNITSNPGIVKFFLQLIKENFFGLQIVIITRIMELI